MNFDTAYASLNPAQKQAVDTVDGPLLVIAGPGTGKTQLLSARVANILKKTDTLPENILCLTFTESGATNMQERLRQFIGQAAYDVNIGTYHAFGRDILARASDYIDDRLDTPIDGLRQHQVVEDIVKRLDWRDPLKQTQYHLKDLIATISEIKRAMLTPDQLRAMADENKQLIDSASVRIGQIFDGIGRMPTKVDVGLELFGRVRLVIKDLVPGSPANPQLGSLADVALLEIDRALSEAEATSSTKPLTAWKNRWLAKGNDGQFVLAGEIENRRLASLASVIESYQSQLAARGWYDFDDMILRAIKVLESNDDLRFSLQEKYLYILLDEYQDTNAAQARLVHLLADNPVHEGRPNIMAVGDDDQAIYAFQGAQYSNMYDFYASYRNVNIISLTENYRSHADILQMADNISAQIDERLYKRFDGISKSLTASNPRLKQARIKRLEFKTSVSEFDYVAESISDLIRQGTNPSQIAVLAPKHRLLEEFASFAHQHNIPLTYEKRENILEAPVIHQLVNLARLTRYLADNDRRADSLWPEVLSYDFISIPIGTIWQTGWQARTDKKTWVEQLLVSEDTKLKNIACWLLATASRINTEPADVIIDYLLGIQPVNTNQPDQPQFTSPLLDFLKLQSEASFFDALSNVAVLKAKLKDYFASSGQTIKTEQLLELVDAYQAAEERMLNTSPYHQADDSVSLMTVFKAKGLEYQYVYMLSVDDEAWGGSGRSQSNKLTLPANLAPTRHSGATDDERLRLLFVALTRAKTDLILTSSSSSYSGKQIRRLKYLDERETESGQVISHAIPTSQDQVVQLDNRTSAKPDALITSWQSQHINSLDDTALKQLLADKLERYQLSPTDLNLFLDTHYGGPDKFLLSKLIGFPSPSNLDADFGNLIHGSLKWLQVQLSHNQQLPTVDQLLAEYNRQLEKLNLDAFDKTILKQKGELSLTTYLSERGANFKPTDKAEISFKYENVRLGDVHLTGTIDRLEIDKPNKQITVIDFKTGQLNTEKRYKYSRQLYLYKLLIEGSQTFRGYSVSSGRLEFVEPDSQTGQLAPPLVVDFQDKEMTRTKQLIEIVWRKIKALDLPSIEGYPASLVGSKQFEDDLLATTID